jgi:multisubunit Na+/H+ antiporter MnhB subunit
MREFAPPRQLRRSAANYFLLVITKSRNLLALILPVVLGVIGGWIVGTILYNRIVRQIESAWHRPANVAIPDLVDVLFGYTVLGVFVGGLLGLLIGVFLYALLRNRNSETQTTILA